MARRHRVSFFTILPSPYQRDLFGALAVRPEIEVSVYYMEMSMPESPWPKVPLRPFEQLLPGFRVPFAGVRWHVNWSFPSARACDFAVLSGHSSPTGQYLIRRWARNTRWILWAERLRSQTGMRRIVQEALAAPIGTAAAVVGMGKLAEADYHKRFPHLPHYSVPYHCSLREFQVKQRPRPPATLRFLFCGQMIERKGVDLLVRSFDALVRDQHDVELRLVGREAELSQFLAGIGEETRRRIVYEGFQPPERLPEYFSRADVFVIPSRHDGWGVVVNQALGAGLPVITSDAVGAGLDLVKHGVNGLHVRAGDLEDLRSAMKTVAVDKRPLIPTWSAASREKALAITPEAGAEKWVHVFDELSRLERNAAGAASPFSGKMVSIF